MLATDLAPELLGRHAIGVDHGAREVALLAVPLQIRHLRRCALAASICVPHILSQASHLVLQLRHGLLEFGVLLLQMVEALLVVCCCQL